MWTLGIMSGEMMKEDEGLWGNLCGGSSFVA
jgi:hypothetical protein